jgi:hypothetical protein
MRGGSPTSYLHPDPSWIGPVVGDLSVTLSGTLEIQANVLNEVYQLFSLFKQGGV